MMKPRICISLKTVLMDNIALYRDRRVHAFSKLISLLAFLLEEYARYRNNAGAMGKELCAPEIDALIRRKIKIVLRKLTVTLDFIAIILLRHV